MFLVYLDLLEFQDPFKNRLVLGVGQVLVVSPRMPRVEGVIPANIISQLVLEISILLTYPTHYKSPFPEF